jgi:hypothetical protein
MSPTLLPAAGRSRESSAVRAIEQRRRNPRIAIDALATTVLIVLVSSAWLMIVPTGDQPILALVESATGSARRGF